MGVQCEEIAGMMTYLGEHCISEDSACANESKQNEVEEKDSKGSNLERHAIAVIGEVV